MHPQNRSKLSRRWVTVAAASGDQQTPLDSLLGVGGAEPPGHGAGAVLMAWAAAQAAQSRGLKYPPW